MAYATYTIFLASSAELSDDRIDFGDVVQELNDRYAAPGRNVRFKLYKWERDLASFAEMRKQEDYNQNIETCRIFVMLYASKVGMYTEEEYDFAYSRFKETGAPQVLVFKKSGLTPVDESINGFEQKIKGRHQQFRPYYKDIDDLRNAFTYEIGKYFDNKILQYGVPARTLFNDGQSVPANFTGREEELNNIKEKLGQGGSLMLINAEGGIGKTTLAAKYWQESLYMYKHNAWLFCENGVVGELRKLAPELKLDLSNLNEKDQINALKSALQNISHDFLLVLDNANKPEDIAAFRQAFRGLYWHVLITSRCKGVLEKEQEYQITHLPPEKAKELFISNYKEEGREFDTLLNQFLAAIGYHTLLIDIFSKNMVELRKRRISFAQFLAQLEGNGLFLERGSFKVVTVYTDSRHKIAATTNDILNILYDFTELTETERFWLVNMALLPAVSHDFVFLCELFRQGKMEFLTLDDLAHKGWLTDDDTGYRISPVIQGIALEKNKATLQQDAKALIDNLNAKLVNDGLYLEYFNEAGPYAVLAESITQHLINQPFYTLSLLNFNACTYYISTGDFITALAYAEKLKSISEKLEDKKGLADSYLKLGNIYEELGRLQQALDFYEDYKRLEEELHKNYSGDISFKNGLALSYSKLGYIHETMGRMSKALKFYEEYNALMEALHLDYPNNKSFINGLAASYERLGSIYEKMENLPEAVKFYEENQKLMEALHLEQPANIAYQNNLAIAYVKLADIKRTLASLPKALKFYEKYNKIMEALHLNYPNNTSFTVRLAVSYERLGSTNEKMENLLEALKFYKEYQKLMETLHLEQLVNIYYPNNLATSYGRLGDIHKKLKNLTEALKFYEKYNKITETLHLDHPNNASFTEQLATSYQRLGSLNEEMGNLDETLKFYEESKTLVEALHLYYPNNASLKNYLATSYGRLGDVNKRLGRLLEAFQFYEDYQKLMKELHRDYPGDVSFKNGLAVSYTKLAGVFLKQAAKQKAIGLYTQAESLWQQLTEQFPSYAEFNNNLVWVQQQLNTLKD